MEKENIVQAVVIADTFNRNFYPITPTMPMGLLPIVGVPLIDFVLESLSQGGVDETILFCCENGPKIKEYLSKCIANKVSWSLTMDVQVMMSDTCQTMGDVMREIDATGIIRGHFILTGINAIANVHFATLLEQHKQICKRDKGAAMTLVYKKVSSRHSLIRSDHAIFLATDGQNNKILLHKKCKASAQTKPISLPLEIVLNHSEVRLHHNLANTNIALCSPSVPPLFSDNFDFQTRDDFIHGILINEEILSSALYYLPLKGKDYAACVTNWKSYQIVSRDILHHWVYPLTIETGALSKEKFIFMGDHIYRNKNATLSRHCQIGENVLIGKHTHINDFTKMVNSIIGDNCTIGKNVTMTGSYILNNVTISDNSKVINSFVGENSIIEENCSLEDGTILSSNVILQANSELKGSIIQDVETKDDRSLLKSTSESTDWENDSTKSDVDDLVAFHKVSIESDSDFSSASSEELSLPESPIPEDTNIFLQEVIDSLARGYEEKLKCDYLILEVNSSRYAYNIQLQEVNFFVVRALLSMPILTEAKNVLSTVKDILKYFKPVVSNYIKTKSSIMDCLKAVEESSVKCEWLEGKAGQILHLLYEADVVDEDSLIEWYEDLKKNESPIAKQSSLVKFFEWLDEASEESD